MTPQLLSSNKNAHICSTKSVHWNDNSCTNHNSPKLETTQMPINNRVDKNIKFFFSEDQQFDRKRDIKYPRKL